MYYVIALGSGLHSITKCETLKEAEDKVQELIGPKGGYDSEQLLVAKGELYEVETYEKAKIVKRTE